MTGAHPPGSRRFAIGRRFALAFIALAALLLRVMHVLSYRTVPTSDGYYYVQVAVERFTLKHFFSMAGFCFFPPGYPFFLKPFFLVWAQKGAVLAAETAQAVLGALTCIVMYRLARRMHSRRAGIAAAFIACLFSHFLFYTSVIMSEALFIPVYFAALLCVLHAAEKPAGRSLYLAGLVMMAAIFVRPAAVSLVPGPLVAAYRASPGWRGRVRALALVAAGGLTLLAPWVVRNQIAYGRLVLLAPNGAINLYIGNNRRTTGRYIVPRELSVDRFVDSAWYNKQTLDFISSDPVGEAGNVLRLKWDTIWEFVQPWPLASSNPQLFIGEHYFFLFSWRTVLVLGLLGLGGLLARSRPRAWIPAACLAIYTLFYLAYFGHSRFRLPAEGFFVAWGGIGVVSLLGTIRRVRRWRAPVWAAAAVVCLGAILAEGGIAAVSTRRALTRPDGILAARSRFQTGPGKAPDTLFGPDPIRIDRSEGRYLQMSLEAFWRKRRKEQPLTLGVIHFDFQDRLGRTLSSRENATYYLEALAAGEWTPITFKLRIPPRAVSCRTTIDWIVSRLGDVTLRNAVLRYAPGNDLAGEFLFPYMQRLE